MRELVWVEISKKALQNNIKQFRKLIGKNKLICACVKANAYGHDLVKASQVILESGADWLSVNSLYEARTLRENGMKHPILILGYVPLDCVKEALYLNCRLVIYNWEHIEKIEEEAALLNKEAKVHIKVETGTNRQGIREENLVAFSQSIEKCQHIQIEGISTHFANIEDTTDHSFAFTQIDRFVKAITHLDQAGIHIPIQHCANSAATILFPDTHFEMVRIGISCYGMWPSNETYVSFIKERESQFQLMPALTWKARVAQIKIVPEGDFIGYGCTYRTSRETRLAILPVGYYDGYDRGISGAHVLIHGRRAPIRGRICMNIIMVDISDIPDVLLEDDVVLLGRDGKEVISAEMFSQWAGTINYEATTRINDRIPRFFVD